MKEEQTGDPLMKACAIMAVLFVNDREMLHLTKLIYQTKDYKLARRNMLLVNTYAKKIGSDEMQKLSTEIEEQLLQKMQNNE